MSCVLVLSIISYWKPIRRKEYYRILDGGLSLNKINNNAPIIPGTGLGELHLNSHISQHKNLIQSFSWLDSKTLEDRSIDMLSTFHVAYECKKTLKIVFNILTGKLQRIIALENYKGTYLDLIYIGKVIDDIKELDIIYDEDEELYFIKNIDGISFEADANNQYVACITVYSLE